MASATASWGKSPERLGDGTATCHQPNDLVPWVFMCPCVAS